jgi:hypothetical protein
MSAPVLSPTVSAWPAEVLDYADRHELRPYLEPFLAATRRVFPTARRLQVSLEYDPDLPDVGTIVFDVQVSDLSPSEAVSAQKRWNRETAPLCPASLICNFCLLLDLVSA